MFLCALEWHVLEIVVKTAEDTNVDNNNVNVVCRILGPCKTTIMIKNRKKMVWKFFKQSKMLLIHTCAKGILTYFLTQGHRLKSGGLNAEGSDDLGGNFLSTHLK